MPEHRGHSSGGKTYIDCVPEQDNDCLADLMRLPNPSTSRGRLQPLSTGASGPNLGVRGILPGHIKLFG